MINIISRSIFVAPCWVTIECVSYTAFFFIYLHIFFAKSEWTLVLRSIHVDNIEPKLGLSIYVTKSKITYLFDALLCHVTAFSVPTAATTRELARSRFFAFNCFEVASASLLQFGAILKEGWNYGSLDLDMERANFDLEVNSSGQSHRKYRNRPIPFWPINLFSCYHEIIVINLKLKTQKPILPQWTASERKFSPWCRILPYLCVIT